MPQLDFSIFPSQAFWLSVNFFLMLFIFSRFIIPKTAEMINLRKAKIDDYLAKAEQLKTKVEETMNKYNQALQKATEEANASLQKTQSEMEAMIDTRQAELGVVLKKQIEESEAKILAGKEKVLKQMDALSTELALDILKKIGFTDMKQNQVTEALRQIKED